MEKIEKAEKQEEIILKLYRKHIFLSATQVYAYFDESTPITSIRRAITVLTDKGLLKKTEDFVQGGYGKREHIYKLVQSVHISDLLGDFESKMLQEMISMYRTTGWHMFDHRKFDTYHREIDELQKRGYVAVRQGINGEVIELLCHRKYQQLK